MNKLLIEKAKKYNNFEEFLELEIKTDIQKEAIKFKNLTDFLQDQQGKRNVLYRGSGSEFVTDNQFWGDFYNHAEDYAGGENEIKEGNGFVVGIEYSINDVYYFRVNEIRDIYYKLTDKELKTIYYKLIKKNIFCNAQLWLDISDEEVIPLVKRYLTKQISENEISQDFLIPLYQKFAKTKGLDIIAFEGNDFGGSTEYVVSNIKKFTNLNKEWEKAQKIKSKLINIWQQARNNNCKK